MINKFKFFVVILVLLLLNSCDAILDTFYPDFEIGNKNIIVNLSVDKSVGTDDIKIILVPMVQVGDRWEMNFDLIREQVFYGRNSIEYEFNGLSDNAYRVFAFKDSNGNGEPDYDEPSVTLIKTDTKFNPDLFDFRDSDSPNEYTAAGYLSNFPGIESQWLDIFNEGEDKGEYVDRTFEIIGPDTILRNNLGFEEFDIAFNDPTVSFESITWRMYEETQPSVDLNFNTYSSPATLYNNNRIWVDFSWSTTLQNLSVDTTIILEVEVDYGNDIYIYDEYEIFVTDEDLNFDIYGPNVYNKSAALNNTFIYDLGFRSTKQVTYIDWSLVNINWETIYYNGNIYTELDPFNPQIQLDTSLLDIPLDDPWWNDYTELFLTVYVEYSDGTYSWNALEIKLEDGIVNGSNYTIVGELLLSNYYAFEGAFIIVLDYDDYLLEVYDKPLFSQTRYLDLNGETDFDINIFDPIGLEQVIAIVIPVSATQDLVWIDDYSLFGDLSGTIDLGQITESDFILVDSN